MKDVVSLRERVTGESWAMPRRFPMLSQAKHLIRPAGAFPTTVCGPPHPQPAAPTSRSASAHGVVKRPLLWRFPTGSAPPCAVILMSACIDSSPLISPLPSPGLWLMSDLAAWIQTIGVRLTLGASPLRVFSACSGGGSGTGYRMADISYLTQREAAEIDEVLMGPLGFSVDQLMVRFLTSSKLRSLLLPLVCYPW